MQLTPLSDLSPSARLFLADPSVPVGEFTMVSGSPQAGKTWMLLSLVASITTGRSVGFDTRLDHGADPGLALYCSREQGSTTLKERLTKLRADNTKVYPVPFRPLSDLEYWKGLLATYKPKIIIFDPLEEYLDATTAPAIREILGTFLEAAREHGTTTLGIRHLRKSKASNPLYQGLGSIALSAMARSELLVGIDPKRPDTRALVHIKSNDTPLGPSQEFKIDDDGITWLGRSELTAQDVLAKQEVQRGQTAVEIAANFILDVLAEGPMEAGTLKKKARRKGIKDRTLKKAKKALGVKTRKETGDDGKILKWTWTLPGTASPEPPSSGRHYRGPDGWLPADGDGWLPDVGEGEDPFDPLN